MCIILPVLHVSCSHTVAIWQHCPKATPSGPKGKKSCINVRQHERPILTRRLCEACSGERTFSRRGGVAERGSGALTVISETDAKSEGDSSAADSGYHSDIIYEEDEGSNLSERSLSPKTVAPQQTPQHRKHSSTSHRSLARKPSWKPNLKRDLSLERDREPSRRDSIDSFLSHIDDTIKNTPNVHIPTNPTAMEQRKRSPSRRSTTPNCHTDAARKRYSTLLHPSPPEETTGQAQFAVAFSAPTIVTVRRPSSLQVAPRPRKASTLLHPSSPVLRPATEAEARAKHVRRKASSLLHPSSSAPAVATLTSLPRTVISIPPQQLPNCKTIISIPPQHAPRPKHGRTSSLLEREAPPCDGMGMGRVLPLRRSAVSEPVTVTVVGVRVWGRRESVLHSCFSEGEGEGK